MADRDGRWRRDRLADARLYLCTDAHGGAAPLAEFLDVVLGAGVDVVQLRDKSIEALDEVALHDVVRVAAEKHGALWAVNDRADIAYAVRPDILHLGQGDLPVHVARQLLGRDVLIGRSTHAEDEVDRAAADDEVDYFCVGPTWPTPTKPGRAAPGPDLLRHAAATRTTKPWFAIGGIDADRMPLVTASGATRVVVVRAITEAADAAGAVGQLRAALGA
ncbi:MAG: thiE [Frankiales bacterium]|nr:thiE [Frankiales bacterium]